MRWDENPRTASVPPLPSGRFPFLVHFDVLRRFMTMSHNGVEPIAPASVEGGGLPSQAAQVNTAFLCDLGLLVEEALGKFKPTPVAMQFINTQVASDDRARKVLRTLVAKSWFADSAASLLQAKPVASREELIDALTASARAKRRTTGKAIAVVIDYLTYTGFVVRTDQGFVRGGDRATLRVPASAISPRPLPPSSSRSDGGGIPSAIPEASGSGWELVKTNDFDLRIRASPAAVGRLRKQLDLLEEKLKGSSETR